MWPPKLSGRGAGEGNFPIDRRLLPIKTDHQRVPDALMPGRELAPSRPGPHLKYLHPVRDVEPEQIGVSGYGL